LADFTVSVVIPHLNQPQMLARCLDSLAAGTQQPDEIIVVDNGSRELPTAICSAHPTIRLLTEATPGPGPARNTGVATATGGILAFIDADCIADPGWIAAIHAAFADPGAEILGGDVRIAYDDPENLTLLEAYESIYAYRMDIYIRRDGFTGTGNLAVRRRVMEAVGPFAGLGVAEDIDWGRRATAAGFSLRYVAAMRAYHPARRSFGELTQKWDRHLGHFFADATARRFGWLRWGLRTAVMAASPLGEVPKILASDRISGTRARWLAFRGVVRIRLYRARVMAWLLAGGDPDRLTGAWNR
jgi:glycosyltransferase involved in cell wall biosynthesis